MAKKKTPKKKIDIRTLDGKELMAAMKKLQFNSGIKDAVKYLKKWR